MIHTPLSLRLFYLIGSLVVGALTLYALDRLHGSHGVRGQRQAPRTLPLALLFTLFVAAMNLGIYSFIPAKLGAGRALDVIEFSSHIRNLLGYCACALHAVGLVQVWGGWRRAKTQGLSWPRRTTAELDLEDTAVRVEQARRSVQQQHH